MLDVFGSSCKRNKVANSICFVEKTIFLSNHCYRKGKKCEIKNSRSINQIGNRILFNQRSKINHKSYTSLFERPIVKNKLTNSHTKTKFLFLRTKTERNKAKHSIHTSARAHFSYFMHLNLNGETD